MITVKNLSKHFGGIKAVDGVDLHIERGSITGLVGPNGAGKSTILHSIYGFTNIFSGQIEINGKEITHLTPAEKLKSCGIAYILQDNSVFPDMTVEENLLTGAYTRKEGRSTIATDLEKTYTYFPRLKERRSSQAGYTSGGEQQMLAIGRALMSKPKMILLDEPSMGLAPQLVEEIFEIVKDLNQREGVSFLLAEQNTNIALRYANYGYVLENGRVVMDGEGSELRENEDIKEFYLGMGGAGRKSFRDVKNYRRRKRWL